MTSSEADRADAVACLERVRVACSESQLTKRVDIPIDRARETFRTSVTLPLDARQFNRVLAEFAAHLLHNAVPPHRTATSAAHCWAEACRVLNGLSGTHTVTGYEHTLLDVVRDECRCMEDVLVVIAEAMKAEKRAEHRRWVFAREIDGLDWAMKRQLVELLLSMDDREFGSMVGEVDPASLVQALPNLVEAYLSMNRKECGHSGSFLTPPGNDEAFLPLSRCEPAPERASHSAKATRARSGGEDGHATRTKPSRLWSRLLSGLRGR